MSYNYARYSAGAMRWATAQDRRERRARQGSGAQEHRSTARDRVGIVGDAALGAAAVVGLVTDPVQPPNTDQLNDIHQSQVDGRRQSIPQATRDRGTESGGYSRRR